MNNIKSLYFLFLLLVLSNARIWGQKLDHKLGEFIIQISNQYDEREAFKGLKEIQINSEKLNFQKALVPDLRIYQVACDFTKVDEIKMLRLLRKQKFIKHAQFNHLLEYRNTPNDPRFNQQWQYINDGSNGGTIGADLDMDLAWDITTGGLSPNGDTIVICVIDEGYDDDHSDLINNLWVNRKEIPDNNIDDDGNGYIDDHRGWNTYQDNDNLGLITGHGTPVAGIIGAEGNNEIGVAGVNWNVKIMPVVGGGEEALALAAYAYPYYFRKLYNETAGQQGAFVVATNASWGVPRKAAEDAPIWCAFYDSLGVEGILNVAATDNANIDVDEVGDLPTTCPSDYLIAVTNVDRTGEKFGAAGFGKTSIDLGAFGAQSYTISSANSYGNFGGTSAASPHVAGTIGLIYSAPCQALSSLSLNDPAAAALLARQYILEGVVPVSSLDTVTTTGGRLNIFNTLQLVMESCASCPAPALVQSTAITDKAITVEWIQTDSIKEIELQWRALDAPEWTVENDVSSPFQLENLLTCQYYEIRLRSTCSDTLSDFSKTLLIETDGCCRPPSDIVISNRMEISVVASWTDLLAAQSYNVQYRMVGKTEWNNKNTIDASILLDELIACSNYEMQVQTVCDTGSTLYGNRITFSSIGCGACLDYEYCPSSGADANGEWIAKVELGEWSNESESNMGYGDFTGELPPKVEVLDSIVIALTPGYSSQNWSEYFTVWIDYNQDGIFDEIDEVAYDPGKTTNERIEAKIALPGTAKAGVTRMRVSMEFAGFSSENKPEPCERSIDFGEVEDYCIEITKDNIPCLAVNEIKASLITPSASTLSWDELSSDFNYVLEYREVGGGDWIEVDLDTNNYRVSGLLDCTNYEKSD